jgi:predicted esterase
MKNRIIPFVILSALLAGCSKSNDEVISPPAPVGTPLVDKKDIPYGAAPDTAGNTVNLLLDIFYPSGATTANKYPLVVLIHGGGYVGGNKGGMEEMCRILTDSGFVAASINYRLGWRKGTGSCGGDTASLRQAMYRGLQDAHAALRFLVAKKTEYGIDENWIFIGGSSAGGNVALNTTYITQATALQHFPALSSLLGPVHTSGNTYNTSFSIKGLCNMWGGIGDSSFINTSNAVPQISFHGMQDNVVPFDYGRFQNCPNYILICGSLSLHRQLLQYNKPSITHLSPTGGHGPAEYSTAFIMSNTACFFKKIIQQGAISSRVLTGAINSCQP